MPLISVVIPVYNGAKTIGETIASVLNQTLSDFEIVVINDGSQDSTLDVLRSISDPRIKIFSYANAGQAMSRNRGIAHASGEFIALLDADDLWAPDKLEAQYNALEAHPDAVVAYSWTDYIDESGCFLNRGSYITKNGNIYADLLTKNFIENGSNPLIRKWAFAEVGGFDTSLKNADDWDMWLRLAACYPFVCVAAPQVLYRCLTNSLSSNIHSVEASNLRILERCYQNAPDTVQPLKNLSLSNLYLYLTFKTLAANSSRSSGWTALRCLSLALKYQPCLWQKRRKLLIQVLIKAVVYVVLGRYLTRSILALAKVKSPQSSVKGGPAYQQCKS